MLFLIDENLPVGVATELRSMGHDVLAAAETALRGSTDQVLWQLAASEGRVLLTRDLDFPLPVTPRPAGILIMRPRDSRAHAIVELLRQALLRIGTENLLGYVTIVEPGRARQRPYDRLPR